MKKTPFNDLHKQAGARLIDFGGWEMPVQFQGILAEHKAVPLFKGVPGTVPFPATRAAGPSAKENTSWSG